MIPPAEWILYRFYKTYSMKLLSSIAGGLGGALTLTILQELIKRADPSAPRLDLLGKEAAAKLFGKAGKRTLSGKQLYATGLAGDILFNTLYYSLAGARAQKAATTGGVLGIGMGVAAVMLPKLLDFHAGYTGGSNKRKLMTMGLYLAGGLVAAGIVKLLEKKKTLRRAYRRNQAGPVLDITV
jgi:hypothetical protein